MSPDKNPESYVWKRDFPISWVDDHYVTRREFTKSLVLVSCAAFVANGTLVAVGALDRRRRAGPFPEKRVASLKDLPVGGSTVFDYPVAGGRGLLVRLDEERVVAYGQKCTHLGCPVLFQSERKQLHCPCHEGWFDATDGKVLAGPPPRPLPKILLDRRGDEIWAVGVER